MIKNPYSELTNKELLLEYQKANKVEELARFNDSANLYQSKVCFIKAEMIRRNINV